jgi:hypothetical protein
MTESASKLIRLLHTVAPGAFATNKGVSARCPFCMTESSRGREKFLIFINDDGLYSGHHCFVCRESGGGLFGLRRVLEMLGKKISLLELEELAVDTSRRLASATVTAATADAVAWPPPWIVQDDDVTRQAVSYLKTRGILNPGPLLERYDCVASRVVMTSRGQPMDYPCIVWPMTDARGVVIGWSSRSIGEPREGLPKSMGMPGGLWKKNSVFGLSKLDTRLPITIVEGFVSALATPNAVATCGKAVSAEQVAIIASSGASHIILALDPDVPSAAVRALETAFILAAPDAAIHLVPWSLIDARPEGDQVQALPPATAEPSGYGPPGGDPADRGAHVMATIIKKLVRGESFDES